MAAVPEGKKEEAEAMLQLQKEAFELAKQHTGVLAEHSAKLQALLHPVDRGVGGEHEDLRDGAPPATKHRKVAEGQAIVGESALNTAAATPTPDEDMPQATSASKPIAVGGQQQPTARSPAASTVGAKVLDPWEQEKLSCLERIRAEEGTDKVEAAKQCS